MATKQAYKCSCCGTAYMNQATEFFSSRSPLFEGNNRRTAVCKDCVEKLYNKYVQMFDGDRFHAFYRICEAVGWYYNEKAFEAVLWKANMFSEYSRRSNTGGCNGKSFEDNIYEEFKEKKVEKDEFSPALDAHEVKFGIANGIEMTLDTKIKWGDNFKPYEYVKLENLYSEMVTVNPRMEETPQDRDYLKKICLTSVLLDRAYTEGDEKKIKALNDSYSKLMQDSKLRAMDKTEADKNGGLRNFSQLYAEVERDDFILPWEKYRKLKGVNQDIVDRTIMHIENHTRRFRKEEMFIKPPPKTPKLEKDEVDNSAVAHKDFIEADGGADD